MGAPYLVYTQVKVILRHTPPRCTKWYNVAVLTKLSCSLVFHLVQSTRSLQPI
jgi:hypothetical protein